MSFLVKILGFADLAAAAALFTANWHWIPARSVLWIAVVLLLKGVIFISDPVSKFDIILAFYVALTIVYNVTPLSILFGLYIGFKGLYSLF